MAKRKIEDIVYALSEPIAEKNACEVVDVEFKKEGTHWFLRIFIDKDNGVTIDDCETVSREISNALDEADPIEQSYYLEVSSPGLDRPLKKDGDFKKFIGNKIEIKLYQAMEGSKLLNGILKDYDDNNKTVYVELENGDTITLEREKIAIARLAVDF